VKPVEHLGAALRALGDAELEAVADLNVAHPAPGPEGLVAFIEHAADVERLRRLGIELPLRSPEDAIGAVDSLSSLAAAARLRDEGESPGLRHFYARVVDALATGTRH
jgi:hypothetical protein